ncbi:uncharacterized protein LOC135365947 isoform X2 [Ornithodoros turicata]|uniref:uncharacterized protein LOC135365947 isoform X2 n=1 Tax=Ornithodoros turicata TaxID=34597 RepID=UPI00313A406E
MAGQKQCSVHLFHRILEERSARILRSVSSCSKQLQHWMVYFIFDDGTVLECDGEEDAISQKLRGNTRLIKHSDVKSIRKDMILLKDGVCLSKGDIREVVDELNLNCEKYDVVSNNCQHWIKRLLGRLGVPVSHIDLEEATAIGGAFVVVVAAAAAAAAAATALFRSASRKSED